MCLTYAFDMWANVLHDGMCLTYGHVGLCLTCWHVFDMWACVTCGICFKCAMCLTCGNVFDMWECV